MIVKNHEQLVCDLEKYQGLIAFIDGSVEAVKSHLLPYLTESANTPEAAKAFANRSSRLYNINDCEPYLHLHLGHLSQEITIKTPETDAFKQIKADVTGFGMSAEQMAREMIWYGLGEGKCGVLVDRQKGTAPTVAEAKARGERSYQVLFRATEIRDWERYEAGPKRGKLKKVVLDAKPYIDEKGSYAQFRMYTLDEAPGAKVRYQLLRHKKAGQAKIEKNAEYDCEVKEDFEIEIDTIPFQLFGEGADDSYLANVWPLNKALLNRGSEKSNCNSHQGFQRSFVFGANPEEISAIGEHLISIINNEKATISTIDAGSPDALEREEALIRRRLDRIAKFEFNQLSDDTRQVQSADSKAKDLVARKGIYNNTMDNLTEALKAIYVLHAKFESANENEIEVTIGRDFGLEDAAAENAEMDGVFAQARELGAVEVQKAILRTRIQNLKLVPKKDQTREAMLDELDADIEQSGQQGSQATNSGGFVDKVFQ